jgi:hypothetical protein
MFSLALLPPLILAQGFGLDLTEEGTELRPSLAVLGVQVDPPTPLSQRVGDALVKVVQTGAFSRVERPEPSVPARGCREAECLRALAHELGVDRILTADLDAGETLRVHGFDWGRGEVETVSVPTRSLGTGPVDRRLAPALQGLLQTLSRPLGELEVTVEPAAEELRWGNRVLGAGAHLKVAVPAGTQPLVVTAEGYQPHEEEVEVRSAGQARVEVSLAPIPPPPLPAVEQIVDREFDARPRPPEVTPVWERPAFFVAVAGAAVLGAGLVVGQSARVVQAQAIDADGDGVLDVTRAEMLGAQRRATVANVLGTVGALALAGGVAGVMVHGSF